MSEVADPLPTVPKPPGASRTASLVSKHLPASQSAITRLENAKTVVIVLKDDLAVDATSVAASP